MDEAMIHRWNMVVKPNDIVYHLGDFNWGKSVADVVRYRSRLNGTIHLICGNHDKKNICAESLCFESIADIATIKIDGDDIVLCHYPLAEWAGYYRGAWHLHGHCHGTLKSKEPRRVDVGVDSWSFAPVSLEEIKRAA
jgi:calcineurin-like phosphoesterase family protein